MARVSQVNPESLISFLKSRNEVSSLEIAKEFGVSRPTISRVLANMGKDVVRIGAARQARYSLRRNIGNLGNEWPIYRINQQGDINFVCQLESVKGGFRVSEIPPILRADYPDGFFPDLPFFLVDVQPQGFLGRIQARRVSSELQVPEDIREWTSNDILTYLVKYGDDLPGNIVVGEQMAERVRNGRVGGVTDSLADAILSGDRVRRYDELAERVIKGDTVGSSAGGEQPKFATWLMDESQIPRAVIVKFSPSMNTSSGRRWADLLLAESIALEILNSAGIAAAHVEIVEAGNRRFLEVSRFDRIGPTGRRGLISLSSVEAGLIGGSFESWAAAAEALTKAGLLEPSEARQLRRLWCFGQLIGNTDMHFGNASLWWNEEPPFGLAPIYDMLPMILAPSSQGELVTRQHPVMDRSRFVTDWESMIPYAIEFWKRISLDSRFTTEFQKLAVEWLDKINEFQKSSSQGIGAVTISGKNAETFLSRYPNIAQALDDQKKKSDTSLRTANTRGGSITDELAALRDDFSSIELLTEYLFPEGVSPRNFALFTLRSFRYLDSSDEARLFVGNWWGLVCAKWDTESREAFLWAIIENRHDIFAALDSVGHIFQHVSFSASTMLPWLQETRKKLGNDLYQRGFWFSVFEFTKNSTAEAVAVAEEWLEQNPDDTARGVIARIIGWSRANAIESSPEKTRLQSLESKLSADGSSDWRALYIESWWRGPNVASLTEEMAIQLRDRLGYQGQKEEAAWCFLLGTIVRDNNSTWPWVCRELEKEAARLGDAAVIYWIANTAIFAWEAIDSVAAKDHWENLLISVLPFDQEATGLWKQLDFFLSQVCRKDKERTVDLVRRISQKSGPVWAEKLKDSGYGSFMTSIRETGLHVRLANELCFGKTVFERQIGLTIFTKAFVETFSASTLENIDVRYLELFFREVQRQNIDASALGRIHSALSSVVSRFGESLADDFYTEVELQSYNTLAYRESIAFVSEGSVQLRAIQEKVSSVFERLQKAANEPALRMQVPGYGRAANAFQRKFSRDVNRTAEEKFVFMQLIKKVQLLYGKDWRTLESEGNLSPASVLGEFSHSFEMPRMEFIDPEGMHWRRIRASSIIRGLSKDVEPDESRF